MDRKPQRDQQGGGQEARAEGRWEDGVCPEWADSCPPRTLSGRRDGSADEGPQAPRERLGRDDAGRKGLSCLPPAARGPSLDV
uniref:Uncharacterized protein n=1 Tax=Rangifer tarandus platyrhynchus TaxID=3082113 RepID=A0ACB0FEC6_RANTA|nr:unnamed protein product [Rangifer tarandus platyrhynchus]